MRNIKNWQKILKIVINMDCWNQKWLESNFRHLSVFWHIWFPTLREKNGLQSFKWNHRFMYDELEDSTIKFNFVFHENLSRSLFLIIFWGHMTENLTTKRTSQGRRKKNGFLIHYPGLKNGTLGIEMERGVALSGKVHFTFFG